MIDELLKFSKNTVPDAEYYRQNQITQYQYTNWTKDCLLDLCKGLRYGQSFCNQFDITDNILYYTVDCQRADQHIQKYYVK